ncbi:MAG: LysR family transcriptional regulator [Mesorhizobium sp.]|nr:MAG: LysR family transcriptional regulator [Mesorhizobium sp.]
MKVDPHERPTESSVAETGSFTMAANAVFRTPSAVSLQIKKCSVKPVSSNEPYGEPPHIFCCKPAHRPSTAPCAPTFKQWYLGMANHNYKNGEMARAVP